MISEKDNKIVYLIIILTCVFLSFSHSLYQVAINGGLTISEIIKYPEPLSPMKYYYHNSWTLLHQFAEILLNSGLSIDNSSRAILFLSTLCFGISSFLIVNKLTFNKYLALLVSILMLILQKNFGDTDYPSLIFSNQSYGMFSLALASLIFSLILNENFKYSGFFTLLLISVHPVIGFWMLSILVISLIIYKDKKISLEFFKGGSFGLVITLISLFFFYSNYIEKVEFDSSLYKIYMELWDGHRNLSGIVHYEYLIKTLLLFATLNTYYFLQKNKQKNFFHLIINLSITFSTIFYLSYKFFPNLFPDIFVRLMPTRFLILHSFIGWPLIISIIYFIFLKLNSIKKFVQIFIFAVLIIHSIQHYKKFIFLKNNFMINISKENKLYNFDIFKEISKLDYKGYFITSSDTVNYVNQYSLKPVLLDTQSLDFLSYHPYLIKVSFEILEDIYDVQMNNPPNKNDPRIPNEFIKKSFEAKNKSDWEYIKKKYNANYVVVPKNWKINLNLLKSNNFYSIYQIE